MTRLIMTLLVRDEQDIIRDNIEFHLNHGVDFIVATDNASTDGTPETLREFQRLGLLHLLDEPAQDFAQSKWVTRMALLARDRFRADWVLNNDADEFWYPASGDLKSELRRSSANMLMCRRKNMLYPVDRERRSSWQADLIYRVARPEPMPPLADRLRSPLPCPYFYLYLPPKALCRAEGLISVEQGNHTARYDNQTSTDSDNIVVYHYPIRSREQFVRKIEHGGAAYQRNRELPPSLGWHWRRWYRMAKEGDTDGVLREAMPTDRRLMSDLRSGHVVVDRRILEAFDSGFQHLYPESSGATAERGKDVDDQGTVDTLASFVLEHVDHASVIHFGCGRGTLLLLLQRHGKRVTGVGCRVDRRDDVLDEVRSSWVFRDVRLPTFVGRADLVLCLDPCGCTSDEHLDTLSDSLARASERHIILGGFGTESPNRKGQVVESAGSWLRRLEDRGFVVDERLTARLHDALAGATAPSQRDQTLPTVLSRR